MKKLSLLFLTGMFLTPLAAQVDISATVFNRIFLLQESIPLTFTIENNSGETLRLGGEDSNGILRFSLTNLRLQLVRRTGVPILEEPWVIPSGTRSTREFDLADLFQFSSAESYRANIVLYAFDDAWEIPTYRFELVNGQLIERIRRRNLDRSFHLRKINRKNANELLLQVKNFQETRILGTYELDQVLMFFPPEMRIDSQGFIHILFYKYAELMVYARFSPAGDPLVLEYIHPMRQRPTLVAHEEYGFWVPDGRVLEREPEGQR
ncbi:MAG: hypothetical protein JJU05_01380 [Verrucomicrobia bacterium]|nr:hypothetical protein [Verrucomicrobiota bacterium]MCH8528294.1 hypothetical protein [Kiritimatiellia bacterium]